MIRVRMPVGFMELFVVRRYDWETVESLQARGPRWNPRAG